MNDIKVIKLLSSFTFFGFLILFFKADDRSIINSFILSLTLNERDDPFMEPINRVLLKTNLFIKTCVILIFLRSSILRISV
jgi:hypothetical protein